jgi:hypothetical protein
MRLTPHSSLGMRGLSCIRNRRPLPQAGRLVKAFVIVFA